MAHQSENSNRLTVSWERIPAIEMAGSAALADEDIHFLVLPFGRSAADFGRSPAYMAFLRGMATAMPKEGVLCVLTSPQDAAETVRFLEGAARFQLWVAVRLARTHARLNGLPEAHASLVVLAKYNACLRHTKTRIGYTYCPACDRTTKDYGGKKHTYHQYGTLMSDVWRDIPWNPKSPPTELATRLADLFGLAPYRRLRAMDLTGVKELQPASVRRPGLFAVAHARGNGRRPPRSRLILGDCLKVLPTIPDSSIDFCFADPPYNLDKKYDQWDDALEIRAYFQWCDRWLTELARVLKPGCTCAVLNVPLWAVRHYQFMKTCLSFQNWIVWEALGLPVRMIMPAHYAVVCFSKGKARVPPWQSRTTHTPLEHEAVHCTRQDFCVRADCERARAATGRSDTVPISDLWWDIHRLKHNSRRVDHPCQLPPAVMRRLIAYFTHEHEIVLDPFNGVGTSSLCAAQLGRGYIGIELSEKYHSLATDRHNLLARGGDPFAKSKDVPTAKNSRVRRMGHVRYPVAKKALQLEVKTIAVRLGRLPTRAEVAKYSRYPMSYFEDYFVSWGEVCAAARTTGMSEKRHGSAAETQLTLLSSE